MLKYTLKCSFLLILFVSSVQAISLQQKLQKQWQNFERAKQILLAKNRNVSLPIEKRQVSRKQWEETIELKDKFSLTDENIKTLIKKQNQRISKAKKKAILSSVIDFQALKELPSIQFKKEVKNFCTQVPKGGMLHIHPFGTFNRKTVSNFLLKYDPVIPTQHFISNLKNQNGTAYLYPNEIKWLKQLPSNPNILSLSQKEQNRYISLMFLPKGNHSFERFDAIFWILGFPINNYLKYYKSMLDFGERAAKQNVSYVEFTANISSASLPLYLSLADEYKKKYNIILRVNHSFYRLKTPKELMLEAEDLINLIKDIKSPLVVGVDLLGNESYTPALERGQTAYATILNSVLSGQSNLHRTIHAGELGNLKNPRDAMIMGVERLGHGVALQHDPVAIEYAILKKIAIEINLVSNLKLKSVHDLKKHPFLRYLRLGLPVSFSTDDEGIFETDINTECSVAIENSDITYFEMKQMAFNSIETSFALPNTKNMLKKQLVEQFSEFEEVYLAQSLR